MNLPYRFTAFAFAVATLGFTGLAQQSSPTASGHWQGSLKVPGQDLVVVVDLAKNAKGTWIGSFSMPELGATDIPVDQLTVVQTKVHFLLTGIPGSSPAFDGNLSADGNELAGTFSDVKTKSPLTLIRSGAAKVKLPLPNTPLTKDFEGTWHATLGSGDSQIRVLLKLTRATDGTATGMMVNVDQGNREVPLTSIQQKDKVLEFEIRSVAVRFHGTLNAAGGAVAGEWTQMSRAAPVTFERGAFPPNSPLTKALEGTWQATLDAGGEYKIVLALMLTRDADGAAAGTLRNTSESGKELPVTTIALKNKSVEFAVKGLGATFSGTLNNAGTEITGTWSLAGTDLPLTFKRSTAAEKKP
jgi:hypothetical protein